MTHWTKEDLAFKGYGIDGKSIAKASPKRKNKHPEYDLQRQIVNYLWFKYPDLLCHSDLVGINLPQRIRGMYSALNPRRGHPDLMIYEQRFIFCGLALELKAECEKLHKKDGSFVSEHVKEQADYLDKLEQRGWKTAFAVGFDEAIVIIEQYLKLREPIK